MQLHIKYSEQTSKYLLYVTSTSTAHSQCTTRICFTEFTLAVTIKAYQYQLLYCSGGYFVYNLFIINVIS